MVNSSDLRQQPSSDNSLIRALLGTLSYNPGYVISVALEAQTGDAGLFGGALWASTGAKDAFTKAAAAWSAVANVTITIVSDNYQGTGDRSAYTWVEQLTDLGDTVLGEHALPGPGDLGGAFNLAESSFNVAGNREGGYSFVTFLHEIGHGLGLTHPFDGPANLPGVTGFYSAGDNGLNTLLTTVMSYNDNIGGIHPVSDEYGWVSTPMAFDIAAIQLIYGPNMSTRAGNDIYLLPTQNNTTASWLAIWDAGGIDTISAAGSTAGAVIDLRPASLLNHPGGGGWVSRVNGVYGGITIANGVVIENATGSDFNDQITGNDAANTLVGAAGEDRIWGGRGNDSIEGGAGRDELHGGDGDDLIVGGTGLNILYGDGGNDRLIGGNERNSLYGADGNDRLEGGADSDVLDGGTGVDSMVGGGGADVYEVDSAGDTVIELADGGHDMVYSQVDIILSDHIEDLSLSGNAANATGNASDNFIRAGTLGALVHGGSGNDRLFGSQLADGLSGDDGDDLLEGQGGDDTLYGGDGNDRMYGGFGLDKLYGGNGDDQLYGGIWVDDPYAGASFSLFVPVEDFPEVLSGGEGNDTFYLEGASGTTVTRDLFSGEVTPIHYTSHTQIDGGNGWDTLRIASEVDFKGSLSSIECFAFFTSLADMIAPRPGDLGPPGVLILKDGQVDLLMTDAAFMGEGRVELHLAETSDVDGSHWTVDTNSAVAFHLYGGAGNNRITGTLSSDRIEGGAGDDTLIGGAGNDILLGGDGQDTAIFVGNRADYQITVDGWRVRIVDQRDGANDGNDRAEGIERFQFADVTVTAADIGAQLSAPSSSPFRLFASAGFDGTIGGSGQVFGTLSQQKITVLDVAGTVNFDASFNRGADIIQLPGVAAQWSVVSSGSAAIFTKGDLSVSIPTGIVGTAIAFDDGFRSLHFDQSMASFMIGGQIIGLAAIPISAAAQDLVLFDDIDPAASARLFLGKDSSVSAGGTLMVFGTNGSEHLTLTHGDITLDASFNRGGDTLALNAPASSFQASVSGSSVSLDSSATHLSIPIGPVGMALSFAGADSRLLVYDSATSNIFLDSQRIGPETTALTTFG